MILTVAGGPCRGRTCSPVLKRPYVRGRVRRSDQPQRMPNPPGDLARGRYAG